MDLNNDGTYSKNLLFETSCENEEILRINSDNTLYDLKTFSPLINISNNRSSYIISEDCNTGSLGFGSSFVRVDNELQLETNGKYILNDENKLIRVFEEAVNIYNHDHSNISEKRDLVLVYTKK